MRFSSVILAPLFALSTVAAYTPASTANTDQLAADGLSNLATWAADGNLNGSCTLENAAVRREWGNLTTTERQNYTNAVLCLMSAPAKTNATQVPGAKTRYDDFLYQHINQTLTIHQTANFLSWHRWFVYTYEQALRNECGYTGYQPYCKLILTPQSARGLRQFFLVYIMPGNWGRWAADPINSPIFDGGDYSMSGNGVYEAHNCTEALPTDLNCIPAGQGGGCIYSGPFKKWVLLPCFHSTVHLGPVDATLAESGIVDNNGTSYNPRCLKRDVSSWVSTRWSTEENSTTLITENSDIDSFQDTMQGDFDAGEYGVHGGGHFTIGGDPGGDIYTSPGDPVFWLHHGQIDRTWWIWQNQDIANRQNAISGTITMFNSPASRNGTLDDVLYLGVNADDIAIKDVMSTVAGPLCYIYM
ncbi:Tyrosinase-like protein orsC [Lachnellula cervina]|uniref:Tyrosinase-like protein orsC n=1 Tax=Lachnellula cervina TaxID=1316786 RepID=A0A7D8UMM7_9HELO|nr:Tyrosinase-like protein orsC [Lachnellula cervina]